MRGGLGRIRLRRVGGAGGVVSVSAEGKVEEEEGRRRWGGRERRSGRAASSVQEEKAPGGQR